MPTFAHRFRRNLPNKFEEWICSSVILGIGIIWLVFPENFDRPDMAVFLDIMDPKQWTGICILVGLLRVVAISFNGEFPVTGGLMRFVGALIGCALFGAFFGRAMASSEGLLTLGTVLYTGYFVMDIRNAVRSAADGFNGWRKVSYVAPVVR
jgi:hypothetical protein